MDACGDGLFGPALNWAELRAGRTGREKLMYRNSSISTLSVLDSCLMPCIDPWCLYYTEMVIPHGKAHELEV